MTDGAFNPADLLSGLASNPELLKNVMQMASALASSGALNGLFGGAAQEAQPQPSSAAPAASPQGSFADLLAGLMNSSAPSGEPKADSVAASGPPVPQEKEQKRRPTPCHEDRVQLLRSICPFLPEEKREKVQFLIKLLGLFNAAEHMGLGRLF